MELQQIILGISGGVALGIPGENFKIPKPKRLEIRNWEAKDDYTLDDFA